jgi:hypothetical protein
MVTLFPADRSFRAVRFVVVSGTVSESLRDRYIRLGGRLV